MIFVDTGAWFASVVPSDSNHQAAARWLAANTEPLITTDYVVDETLTLLRVRGDGARAARMGEAFFAESVATLHFLAAEEIRNAWGAFRQFADKDWSFTDCTSKVVMERLGIKWAFAFDQHFRQFGSIVVVP